MIIENKECPDAEGQYNKSSLSRELSDTVKLQSYNCSINMGLLGDLVSVRGVQGGGGAGSEVWNRVYMIAPVSNLAE